MGKHDSGRSSDRSASKSTGKHSEGGDTGKTRTDAGKLLGHKKAPTKAPEAGKHRSNETPSPALQQDKFWQKRDK